VVNASNNTVVTKVGVGTAPVDVAVSPNGSRVYAVNSAGSLSVINTATNKVVGAAIAVGVAPSSAAVSPDGSRVYVTNGNDSVSVIDTSTNTVVQTFATDTVPGSGAHDIAVSADGRRLYLTDMKDRMLRRISVNRVPALTAGPTVTPDTDTGVVTGSFTVADADADPLSYTVTGPAGGAVIITTAATAGSTTYSYVYTPTPAARQQAAQTPGEDTDAFTVAVGDGQASVNVGVTVPVSPTPSVGATAIPVGSHPIDEVVAGNRLYVLNSGDGSVSVIDIATNHVINTIPNLGYASPMAASSDGRYLYLSQYDSYNVTASVEVVDTTTRQVVDTVTMPKCETECWANSAGITDIAISPDDRSLYVSELWVGDSFYAGTVTKVDTATNSIAATSSGPWFTDIAVSPDGSRVYGGEGDYRSIYVLDAQTLATVGGAAVTGPGGWPSVARLELSPDGKRGYAVVAPDMWYSTSDTLAVIDTDNTNPQSATYNTQIATITVPAGAHYVKFSPDGSRAYVAHDGGKTVTVIDTATNTVIGSILSSQIGGDYAALAVGPNGTLYFSNYANNAVYAVTPGQAQAGVSSARSANPGSVTDSQSVSLMAAQTAQSAPTAAPAAAQSSQILAANTAPTAKPSYGSPNQATGAMSGSVNGSDVDPNTTLTYTLNAAPAGGPVTVNGATGAFAYTPTEAARLAAGKTASADFDNFTVSVGDGQAATAVTVSPAVLPAVVSSPVSATVGNNPAGVAVSSTKTYVVNQGSNTVSVIDRANPNQPPVTINVVSSPTAVVVSPDNTRVYAAGNGGVSVINTTTNKVIRTLSTGTGQLNGIAVSPNGQRVYATNTGTNRVVVLNPTATNPVVKSIVVGTQPTGIAVSKDGSRLYVANSGSNTVSVINPDAATPVLKTIAVGAQPTGVVVSPDGSRVYVSNAASNTVTALNPTATNPVVATIAVGAQPRGLGISPDGSIVYVANTDDTVSMINTRTGTVITAPPIGGAPGQHGLAVSPDGRQIYVSDAADRAVRVLTINRGNTAPTPSTPIVGTPDPGTGAVNVTLTFEDTDGDFASHSWAQPASGTVTDGGAGVYIFTPNKAARDLASGTPGPDTATFTITVTDILGAATSVDVTVPVVPNPAPVEPAPPTNYVVTPVTVGTGPSGVAVTDAFTYVINYDSNNITVIDTATNQFVKNIDVGRGPLSVAASEEGKRVYVSNSLDNTVSVLDATPNTVTTNTVVDTIEIDLPGGYVDNPEAGRLVYDNKVTELALNREGTRLYVNATDGSVRVVDTQNDTVIRTAYLGTFNDLKVSPDGTRLYGTPGVGLTVIDTDTMTAVGVQAGPVWDHNAMQSAYTDSNGNIAVSPDGKRVYVTYSATTVATGTGGHTSGSFITDAQGITWMITGGSGGVSVIDTDPASATYNKEIARVTVPDWAQDLVVSDGRLYVTDWDDMSVTVIDTTTNAIVGTFTTDQTRSGGRGLWVLGQYEWYPDYVETVFPVAAFSRYVTAAPNGTVYVTDYGNGAVYVVTPGSPTV
jgi:YVTN family beta-propeller protein